MTETLANPQSQDEKNSELLRQSELGVILERAYIEATNLDPRLEEVEILPLPDDDPGIARAKPSWSSETGKNQIFIRLGNLDATLAKINETMDGVPGARQLFADKIGVRAEDVTPDLLYVFGVSHELGHTSEYFDFADDREALRTRNKQEKAALPIGHATVSAMMQEGTTANTYVQMNWDAISTQLGVDSMGALLEKQHTAYRGMTSEAFADNFAASVFDMNPVMVDQLTGPNRAEYRNWPAAA